MTSVYIQTRAIVYSHDADSLKTCHAVHGTPLQTSKALLHAATAQTSTGFKGYPDRGDFEQVFSFDIIVLIQALCTVNSISQHL